MVDTAGRSARMTGMAPSHPVLEHPSAPAHGTLGAHLLLRIAAGTQEIPALQRELVDLVESGRAQTECAAETARPELSARDPRTDPDEALVLLAELVRRHDRIITDESAEHTAFLTAVAELNAEAGVLLAADDLHIEGAHAVGDTLGSVLPGAVGYLACTREAEHEALIGGRFELEAVATAADHTGEQIARTAAEAFVRHGLSATVESSSVVLDGAVLVAPRNADGLLDALRIRGTRYDAVDPGDDPVARVLDLVDGKGARLAPVRVWSGEGWLVEIAAEEIIVRHLASPWQRSVPRRDRERLRTLLEALVAGDGRALLAGSERRSRRVGPDLVPGARLHPAFRTIYPPTRDTLPGSLMLLVAAGADRPLAALQAEALTLAEREAQQLPGGSAGVLDPDEVLLLLDDVLALHDEAVDMVSIDVFRTSLALGSLPEIGVVMGMPRAEVGTGAEMSRLLLAQSPEADGRAWVERSSYESAVLTGLLPVQVTAQDPETTMRAVQHLAEAGLPVRPGHATAGDDGEQATELELAPLEWTISPDLEGALATRRLALPLARTRQSRAARAEEMCSPLHALDGADPTGGISADEDVTVESVCDAAAHLRGSQALEVWTDHGWQLDISGEAVRLAHVLAPTDRSAPRPDAPTLHAIVADLLAGRIGPLLARDWQVTTPGIPGRRRSGGRGPVRRMHPAFSTAFAPDERTLVGQVSEQITAGFMDYAELREWTLQALLDHPGGYPQGRMVAEREVDLLLARMTAEIGAACEGADSSSPALAAALEALDARGIVSTFDAFTVAEGHQEGRAIARAASAEGTELPVSGYLFIHSQDVARVVSTGELYVGFGAAPAVPTEDTAADAAADPAPDPAADAAVGARIVTALQDAGLHVEWDGSAQARILVHDVHWVRPVPDPAEESAVRHTWLTDRWGTELDEPADADTFLRLWSALHGPLGDAEESDPEHTVIDVSDSHGWFIEATARTAVLGHVEEGGVDLETPLRDAEHVTALVTAFLEGGPAAAAELMRSPQG